MMSRSQQVIESIVGMIFEESVRCEIPPEVVMRKVRETLDNKMICIKAANPANAAEVIQMIHKQLVTTPNINCRCAVYSLGEWGGVISPEKIIYSGNRTIVFWNDGTKTIVKLGKGQEFDDYTGFIAAYAKKMFSSTSRLKKLIKTISSYDKSAERLKAKQLKKAEKAKNSDETKN